MSRSPLGIIIVDHGSKLASANAMLEAFVRDYADRHSDDIVEPAHMELAEPSIAQAFDRCVARGARSVVVCPYFLSPGRHSQRDIPRLVQEAAAKHPQVPHVVAEPIGLHPLMIEVIGDRVAACRGSV